MTEHTIHFVGWLFALTVYGIGGLCIRAYRDAERHYRPEVRRWN